MASTAPPGSTPCPYSCDTCDQLSTTLGLCARCKTARYCGTACQRQAWPTHKSVCVNVAGQHYYHVPPAMAAPVDPADPSNPLRLRSRPGLTEEEIEDISSCDLRIENHELSIPQRRALADVIDDPVQIGALNWRAHNRQDAYLCNKDRDELVALLKQWVYQRSRNNAQVKAIRILSQSTTFKTLHGQFTFSEMGEAWIRAIKIALGSDVSLSPLAYAKVPIKHLTHYWRNNQYTTLRTVAETLRGEWLHKSLLKKLPADHDYLSRFHHPNVTCKPDNAIVSSLMALGVQGIDEASFWELEDARDELKLQANFKAAAALDQIASRRGV